MHTRTYLGGRLPRRRQDSPSTKPSACASDQPRSSASTLNFGLDRTLTIPPLVFRNAKPGEAISRPGSSGQKSRKVMKGLMKSLGRVQDKLQETEGNVAAEMLQERNESSAG